MCSKILSCPRFQGVACEHMTTERCLSQRMGALVPWCTIARNPPVYSVCCSRHSHHSGYQSTHVHRTNQGPVCMVRTWNYLHVSKMENTAEQSYVFSLAKYFMVRIARFFGLRASSLSRLPQLIDAALSACTTPQTYMCNRLDIKHAHKHYIITSNFQPMERGCQETRFYL